MYNKNIILSVNRSVKEYQKAQNQLHPTHRKI
jgi:hypothetical protein